MGISIQDIVGGSITEGVAKIIGLFKVDPTVALEKKVELDEIQLQMQSKLQDALNAQIQGQIDINKQEAASQSVWVAGWRPGIGWVCGAALFIQFVVAPLFTWVATLFGHPIQFPQLDMKTLLGIMGTMLGFGGMRSIDKYVGVSNGA